MVKQKIYLCKCVDCDEYFIGRELRHIMYYCPHCKKNAVDIEEHYTRILGNVEIIKRVMLPKPKEVTKNG